jgi:prevent-host-death family protein
MTITSIILVRKVRIAMATWQVQEAKSRFSELLDAASRSGPQTITRHGKRRAVVLSIEEYDTLSGEPKAENNQPDAFLTFLMNGPRFEDFEIERDHDTGREIDL